jgi:uncharacterized protein involved in response to NO
MIRRIKPRDIGAEPFRVFFPAAVLAGVLGALLWPLHFWGFVPMYPGLSHARLMADGFFGGVIFGFLGTALPRVLGVPTLGLRNVLILLACHIAMSTAFVLGKNLLGDAIFFCLLASFLTLLGLHFNKRDDLPPPGFSLVLLALICATAGSILSVVAGFNEELDPRWLILQKLLSYQGLVLLPILGVGGFLLPRFFGLPPKRDLPESRSPSPEWKRSAAIALLVGLTIVATFILEALGWPRLSEAIRFSTSLLFILAEIPVFKFGHVRNSLAMSLRIAFALLLAGFFCLIFFPAYRVALLHLTLIGGFAIITFTVATRVILGHSGHGQLLTQPNRWFWAVIGILLFAMLTRISGDFWPKITATHYTYGALLFALAVAIWSIRVLPKVLLAEDET